MSRGDRFPGQEDGGERGGEEAQNGEKSPQSAALLFVVCFCVSFVIQ